MSDAASLFSYLSDAACLCDAAPYSAAAASSAAALTAAEAADSHDPSSVPSLAALGVAARGCMWALRHPAPRGWRPLKGATMAAAAMAARGNAGEVGRAVAAARGGEKLGAGPGGGARDYLPVLRQLAVSARARGWMPSRSVPSRSQ